MLCACFLVMLDISHLIGYALCHNYFACTARCFKSRSLLSRLMFVLVSHLQVLDLHLQGLAELHLRDGVLLFRPQLISQSVTS